ncbi:hypothetical protein HYH02_004944 [Chlamydomonas schloesseri]|uniref:guanylate cyclase n=1 Tax=Chlamydomonas schloesseri TaxID=2026947 RepID=A0A836B817_9CHLO|nr:hypothetical protein HYH02_004944 [Chlamydomonas schloesseri]|eukprot:KAG2450442.1 hypothetical protein HYH02_004944 [Chlamydomonas schloesseri]
MIGWINISVESFVREKFGDGVWEQTLATSGVQAGWVSSCPYPDATTYNLVITASKILGVTPAQALEAYGVYFVEYTRRLGYEKLLKSLGSNVAEFLKNLNDLHLHLGLMFPAMAAPAFKCTDVGPTCLKLHYHSHRPALGPIVVGLLKGLAEHYWGLGGGQLQVELLRGRDNGSEDHEVFRVSYPFQAALQQYEPPVAVVAGDQTAAVAPTDAARSFTLSPDSFYQIFPFHLLLDRSCRVVQAGAVLERLFPELCRGSGGVPLEEVFQLKHPHGSLDFERLRGDLDNAFLLKARANGLELKGQMVSVRLPLHPGTSCPATQDGLLFMGTARLSGLDDMQHHGIYISDIPHHDINRDYVLLAEQRHAEAQLQERLEALTLELKSANARLGEMTGWLDEERRRSDGLLYQMLPPEVASCLKDGNRAPAQEHPEVTILFSDIVGFTEIASRSSPLEVCSLLDELYQRFDSAIEQYPQLYKVETIGDAYMVVCNVTVPCDDHADVLLEFALRMHEEASQVASSLGEPVRIRVGMHSGPVVAGVVGRKQPRFCLFGDTVNTASRMESHGEAGKIHISEACYSCLRAKERFLIRERGNITVKGKGAMRTYLIEPVSTAVTATGQAPARWSAARPVSTNTLEFLRRDTSAGGGATFMVPADESPGNTGDSSSDFIRASLCSHASYVASDTSSASPFILLAGGPSGSQRSFRLLEGFGEFFVTYLAEQNLSDLHLHLGLLFPAMAAPAFKCTDVGPTCLKLHYHSHRPALGPIVVGLLKGLAEHYWGLGGGQLQVELLRGRDNGSEDHEDDDDVFFVSYPHQEALRRWEPSMSPSSRQAASARPAAAPEAAPTAPAAVPVSGGPAAVVAPTDAARSFTLSPDSFYQIFPFHLLLDRSCRVVQAGAVLERLFPELREGSGGVPLEEVFQMRAPSTTISYDSLRVGLDDTVLLRARDTGLDLKGQVLLVRVPSGSPRSQAAAGGGPPPPSAAPDQPGGVQLHQHQAEEEGLLFLGSPWLAGLAGMRLHGIYISDIPRHDATRDFVMLAEQRHAEAQLKERLEALTLELREANTRLGEMTGWLDEERRRSDGLLYQMLPPEVASCLKDGNRAPAQEHPEATVLFSDIVGFTEIASRSSPLEVCSLLDELYQRFDSAIEQYPQLYKVETIGDAYMVVCNVTVPCDDHADVLLEFALRMHEEASQVASSLGEPVRIRVGMHSGPVVAGVVGRKQPRFCLFGDTVNTASRMESHGEAGKTHISEACYSCLRAKERFLIRERGNITVKGKGAMRTYLLSPSEQVHVGSPFGQTPLRPNVGFSNTSSPDPPTAGQEPLPVSCLECLLRESRSDGAHASEFDAAACSPHRAMQPAMMPADECGSITVGGGRRPQQLPAAGPRLGTMEDKCGWRAGGARRRAQQQASRARASDVADIGCLLNGQA